MSNPIIENAIFESKLIDLFSKIDISEVETDYPDEDIEKLKFEETLLEKWWNNKKVRRVTEVGVLAAFPYNRNNCCNQSYSQKAKGCITVNQ